MDFAPTSALPSPSVTQAVVPLAMPRRHRTTRVEYAKFAAQDGPLRPRTELIAGEIIDMTPQGHRHARAIIRLNHLLVEALARRYEIRPQMPMGLRDDTELEPDLCVTAFPEAVDTDHPATALLVIEVAVSFIDYDREVKLRLYASAQVAEYWIVDVAAQHIEVYCDPQGTTYASKRTWRAGEVIQSAAIAELAVPVAQVFSARPG